MMTILNEKVVLAAVFPAVLAITQVLFTTRKQYLTYAKALCIKHISCMLVLPQEPSDEQIRKLRLRFSTDTILDAAIFVSQHIYGNMLYRLSSIVEVCEIDQYLLRSIGRSMSHRERVKSLSKLSQLCSSTAITEQSEVLLDKEEHSIRTYATAALVMARPERAIRYVARLTHRLSLHNVAMLSQLMRRAGAPIAYTPLLASQSQNLQLIGLYLCELFSIIDAEPLMQKLCIAETEGFGRGKGKNSFSPSRSEPRVPQKLGAARMNLTRPQLFTGLHGTKRQTAVTALIHLRGCTDG